MRKALGQRMSRNSAMRLRKRDYSRRQRALPKIKLTATLKPQLFSKMPLQFRRNSRLLLRRILMKRSPIWYSLDIIYTKGTAAWELTTTNDTKPFKQKSIINSLAVT